MATFLMVLLLVVHFHKWPLDRNCTDYRNIPSSICKTVVCLFSQRGIYVPPITFLYWLMAFTTKLLHPQVPLKWTWRTFFERSGHSIESYYNLSSVETFFSLLLHPTKHMTYLLTILLDRHYGMEKHILYWLTCNIYQGDVLTMGITRARPSRLFMKPWKWTEPSAGQVSWLASMTRWRSSLQTTLICSTLVATPWGETRYLVCATTYSTLSLSLSLSFSPLLYMICFFKNRFFRV